jgi:hypothetical protein
MRDMKDKEVDMKTQEEIKQIELRWMLKALKEGK